MNMTHFEQLEDGEGYVLDLYDATRVLHGVHVGSYNGNGIALSLLPGNSFPIGTMLTPPQARELADILNRLADESEQRAADTALEGLK